MRGQAYVFINFQQAARFGHVGWGVALGDGYNFHFGSTDHLYKDSYLNVLALARYMSVPPGGDLDWWAAVGPRDEMLRLMSQGPHIRYHAYKTIEIATPDPARAIAAAESLREGGWHVALNNCVHHVHRVLTAYGDRLSLPAPDNPLTNLIPRRWFSSLPGPAHSIISD
ncbi:MAG TPA: hypothetical protein V6D08_07575 [Candidatus Obscuribacterales bacterium]